jgi:hypothetical protein
VLPCRDTEPRQQTIDRMAEEIIISVHFPKAAGSSLAAAFQSHFGNGFLQVYDSDPLDPLHVRNLAPHLYPLAPSQIPEGTRVIHGHFHLNKYKNIKKAHRITFLREPIENLISIYYYWKNLDTKAHAVYQLFKETSPDIFEFAEFAGLKRLMSQVYFGDVAMDAFNFVGFYDRRAGDLARLSNQLGISLDSQIHANRTSDVERESRDAIMSDRKAIERLRRSLADDCAFYDRLREERD